MLKFLDKILNHLRISKPSKGFHSNQKLNLSVEWINAKFLPKKLLNTPSEWKPRDAGIDEDDLMKSHPELNKAASLIQSGLLEKILCGEKSLYIDIPPINLSAYLDGLRLGAKNELHKNNLSTLEHLAIFGRKRFHDKQPLGKDIDRYQPNNKTKILPFNPEIESKIQILVVLSSEQAQSKKNFQTQGWTEILYGDASNLEEIWNQLSLKDEALISFCHSSDQINDSSPQQILFTFNKRPDLSLLTSDEDFQWSQSPHQPPGNLQNRSRLTTWRLVSRGAVGGLMTIRLQVLKSMKLPEKKQNLRSFNMEGSAKRLSPGCVNAAGKARQM